MTNFKKISLIAAALISSANLMAAETSTDDRISKLEKEISKLKGEQTNLWDTVDAVELKTLKSKLSISPELRLRMDSFYYKNGKIEGVNWQSPSSQDAQEEFIKDYDPAYSARLRLNMNYEIGDTKFVGRLSMHKNTQTAEKVCILHQSIGRASSDHVVFEVDKAYVDHLFNKGDKVSVIGTFGILPTSGGSPSNIAENKPRQSVFPAIQFDMQTYGMIATADISTYTESLFGGTDSFVRLIAAKPYTENREAYYYQCNREIIKSGTVIGVFAETKLPGLGDNTLQFGFNEIKDLSGSPFVGSTSVLDADIPEILGSVFNASANIEFRNINLSGVTAFASIGYSKFDPNGKTDSYRGVENPALTPEKGLDYATGAMPDESGYSIYVGAQYKFAEKGTKIGAEYNQGSKYWFSGTQGSEDPFNKLATRGRAFEAYVIQPISKELWAKVGYLRMHEDYTGSGWHFAESYKKDATQDNWYVMLNAQF